MRKRCNLFLISLSLLACFTFSCAKHLNNPEPSERLVSYSLSSSNYQPFSDITYINGDGAQASASAADSTSYWSTTVATSMNPFNAHMEVKGFNNTADTLRFTISIYLSGVLQASKQDSVLQFSTFDSEVATVIQ
ncbi:MAG TPA: hypothetical protein VEV83_04535 [Parafilimonas sp.]|nr:hypothetical protein [Parafilimonas sp.]